MARKRNCEHLSHLTAIGSSLRFVGAAKSGKRNLLMSAFNFPLYVETKGDDIIAYYDEDFYLDDLRFMSENYGKQLGSLLKPENVMKNCNVRLASVLPETLPMQGDRTWQEIYEQGLESTERDNSGKSYNSRRAGGNYDKEQECAFVKVYSSNEFRANGHF